MDITEFLRNRGTASRIVISVAFVLIGAGLIGLIAPALGVFSLAAALLLGMPLGSAAMAYSTGLIFERDYRGEW